MTETEVQKYILMGHLNQGKQKSVGINFHKYLAHIGEKFKLTPEGHILNMDYFGYNKRSHETGYSKPGEDYTSTINVTQNTQIANSRVTNTLAEAGLTFPHDVMRPPSSGKITVDGEQIDLAHLNDEERKKAIKSWQTQNIWNYMEETPPTGFIFGVQEPNYKNDTDKIGSWASRMKVYGDKTAIRPRALIVASENMDLWTDWEFTEPDLAVCNWQSGTKFGNIKIISYYGDH